MDLSVAVMVCSDSVASGKKEDRAGKVISEKIKNLGLSVSSYTVIPDEISDIQETINKLCAIDKDLIIITGGTGLSKRDVTPEAVIPLLDRRIPGIEEAIRSYGQDRTPYAMLSRSVVGFKGNTLIMALPGSTAGASESMDAVFPSILHLFKILNGFNHGK
jgi:molybdenum cofactor synthesis domain-containing protein